MNERCQGMCKQLAMFGQTCASKCFPGYYAQMNAMQTDVVLVERWFKQNVMKIWG